MSLKNFRIQNEILSLTSFRFCVALVVFLFHCKIHFGYIFGVNIIDKFIENGAVFMTGFFVLSGYIMAYVYSDKDFTQRKEIVNFYFRRFARIYPVYIIATVVYFLFIKDKGLAYNLADYIRIIVNDLFVVQAFFPNMFKLGLNGGTWSISVEFFFYLLFPAILLFTKKSKILILLSLWLTLLIAINIFTEICSRQSNLNVFSIYYSNPIMRLNEFMMGISFFLLGNKGFFDNLPKILKSCVFIFILTTLNFSGYKYAYMGLHILIVPLFGLLIFRLCRIRSSIMNSSVLRYLGKISYSFYMWQFIAIQYGKYLAENYDINTWYIMLLALFINIILSIVSYHLIEIRFRSYLNNKFLLT